MRRAARAASLCRRYTRTAAAHPAYDLVKESAVPEFGTDCSLYRHRATGAEVLSLQSKDTNKVFAITFRTPPPDSTGLPHVLEHSVLCGSKKYTVKEPFTELQKGSLQTYLNAFTYPDRTVYPVASQNLKDFYNLADVYLDAVFYPRAVLDDKVLMQEGWRHEVGEGGVLKYQGVVFNEMKGVYSSPEELLGTVSQQNMFPDSVYKQDYGGDPAVIPQMTFESMRDFHAKYYHPSNSRVFFYGDNDPVERLDFLDTHLSKFGANPESTEASAVGLQPLKSEPWEATKKYPASEEQAEDHYVSVNWVLNGGELSTKDKLALDIVQHLLLSSPTSVLEKALIDSHLGTATIGGGLCEELRQAIFCAGLKGVQAKDVDAVKELVVGTLRKCVKEGFPSDAVAASIHSVEFGLREFDTGGSPRGLSLLLSAMSKWVYGGDPIEAMRFEADLAALKAEVAAGERVFESVVERFLVANSHRCSVTLVPDTGMVAARAEAEKARLAAAASKLDLGEVSRRQQELRKAQEEPDSPEARATIPRLAVADLGKKGLEIPSSAGEQEGFSFLETSIDSASGIAYAMVGYDISKTLAAKAGLASLLVRLLREGGTSKLTDVAMQRRIDANTGGVSCSVSMMLRDSDTGAVSDHPDVAAYLVVKGKCLAAKTDELYGIMHDILTDANLDCQSRAVEILKEERAEMQEGLAGDGLEYAARRSSARYSVVGWLSEQMDGLTYFQRLDDLIDEAENRWPELLAKLTAARADLLTTRGVAAVCGGAEARAAANAGLPAFLRSLPGSAAEAAATPPSVDPPPAHECITTPTQVSHMAASFPMYGAGERVTGSAMVVSRALAHGYLWSKVRVQAGAYGAYASVDRDTGRLGLQSFRDGMPAATFATFENTAAGLVEQVAEMADADIEMSVVGATGDLDSPLSDSQKAGLSLRRFLKRSTAERRQQFRDEVLSTTRRDFAEFSERLSGKKMDVCAVIGQDMVADVQKACTSPFTVTVGLGCADGDAEEAE
eukprot:TRINITY_DN14694_c0_g2_i1.p1 TRINITY_DN14694_c0_g2~~TRINITY_DN14694_c0_g2_i1.p1  ORF type:complete len:1010 (+),score=346.02 TRINITY_DN14694_c0_g2_i1:76-3105(+)